MSDDFYDDDAQYDYEDDDEDDDDESVTTYKRPSTNPLYRTGGGLPGRDRASDTSSTSSVSGRSGVRPYSAGGSSGTSDDSSSPRSSSGDARSFFNRGATSGTSASSSGSSSGSPSSGSSSSGIGGRYGSGSSGSSSSTPSRSSYSSGASGSSDDRSSRVSPGATPTSSSSSSGTFGRYSSGSSSSSSSGSSSASGSSSSTPGSSTGGFRSSSATTSPPSRTSGSSPSSGSSSSSSSSRSDDSKKDDKAGSSVTSRFGAGLSNIRSRVGGGGEGEKKEAKKSPPKDGEKAGLFSRVSASLPIGGNKGESKPKPEKKASDGEKSGIGATLGGFTSRFRGGDKDDKDAKASPRTPSSASSSSASSSSASTGGGRFGGFRGSSSSSASTPGSSSASGNAPSSGGMSAFGRNRNANAATSAPADRGKKPADKSGGGLFSRFTSSIPFVGGGGEDKSQRVSKTRQAQSKIPRAKDDAGLSLDDKLDILGVGLVVTALVLFVSSLSPQQGAITGSINDFIKQIVGWGAFAVPIAFMAVGLWLIVRHFGEDAPEVDPVRVSGVVMLYIGGLMIFQFIETFNEIYKFANPDNLYLFVQASIEQGRGGGKVGAELYYLVISNVGELPGFTLIIGWMIIGIMLATRTSAGELAVFVISIWRSFQVSVQQRAQARAIAQLEAQEAAQISVTRPNAGELAAGSAGALPAPSAQLADDDDYIPIEERAIPIRMGGQMINANEPVMAQSASPQHAVATQSAPPTSLPPAQTPSKLPDEDSSSGRFGSFAARLKSAVPALPSIGGSGNSDDDAKDTAPSDDSGSLLGGLFNRRSSTSGTSDAPAATSQSAPPRTSPTQQPASTSLSNLMRGSQPTADSLTNDRFANERASDRSSFTQRPAASMGSSPNAPTQQPTSPASAPSRASAYSPQPTAPANRFARDLEDKDNEEKPTSINRAGAAQNPFNRVASVAAGAGAALFNNDDDDDSEEISIAPPEDELFSRLPPAQPKGITRTPVPGNSLASRYSPATSTNVNDEDEDEDSTEMPAASVGGSNAIADRISRMNAIRAGSTQPPAGTETPRSLEVDDDEFKADFVDDFNDEDDDDDDESVNFTRPSAKSIFGARPASPTSSATPAPNNADDRARVRPFDLNRDRTGATGTQTAASVSGNGITTGGTSDTSRTSPTPSQPTAPAASSPTSPPWRTDSTPAQRPVAAQQTSVSPPPPQQPQVTQPNINQRSSEQQPDPVINLPQAPRPSQQPAVSRKNWRLPDYRTLLASGSEQDFDREGLVKRARIIEETLQSFGAPGRVVEINTGPVITQFGVEPDYLTGRGGKKSRVKVSAIAQLDKDLQLALGAKSIRVEAPVPGKGYVGIEVPNDEASLVSLRDVMEARQFTKISEKSPLAIALGQSVDGAPISADLASMPHLLIAGTTGSGKSVCVNAVIASILIRNTPEQVKFIMVDPKRVELTGYNGIPHLVAPVVVELERIVGVLKWVTREMDERYKKFSEAGKRNIEDYNKNLTQNMEHMPYIVVIIDELADLMMLAPDETERVITRIAALARATGIHLVIATQRPSVDVVTGLIKANFPARVAFAVASGTDSRVILDQPGADRLLGRGDMLYMSGDTPAPQRLQGVYVSDMEINNITRYWRTQAPPDIQQKPITALVMDDSPAQSRTVMPRGDRFMQPPPASTQRAFWDNNSTGDDDLTEGEVDAQNQEDELYTDAVELVRRLNKASVSLLQRRLRIGYTRAARMIDMMEAENIIGPPTEGSKPREVLPYKK